jgi:hypothetical protein
MTLTMISETIQNQNKELQTFLTNIQKTLNENSNILSKFKEFN